METTKIPLSQCVESSYQNRKELGDVSELARSIEVNGQITPLIVVADGEAHQLVAGHRRTAAMKSLGLEETDAYVMDGWDDARIAQILNAENNHRRELTEAERDLMDHLHGIFAAEDEIFGEGDAEADAPDADDEPPFDADEQSLEEPPFDADEGDADDPAMAMAA